MLASPVVKRKKAEILQLLMLKPDLAILDETDSGLDVDAVRTVSKESKSSRRISRALLVITHSTRILESLHVDVTHVLADGKMILSGDSSLVEDINENGFEKIYRTSGIRSVQEGESHERKDLCGGCQQKHL